MHGQQNIKISCVGWSYIPLSEQKVTASKRYISCEAHKVMLLSDWHGSHHMCVTVRHCR